MKIKNILLSTILALGIASNAFAYNGGANTFNGLPQAYTPVLTGQTDNGVATFTTNIGYFYTMGNMTFVSVDMVTSGTTTKTTTTDNFGFSLPLPAITQTGHIDTLTCDVENATPIQLGLTGSIASAATSALIRGPVGTSPAYNMTQMTWATTSPGIGALTNVITVKCSGWYQTSSN